MRPGAWSEEGFLSPGIRLSEVLGEDRHRLESIGADPAMISERLSALIAAGRGSDWDRPIKTDDYEVEILRVRGFITCPWAPNQFEPCPHGYGGRPTANRFRLRHTPSGVDIEGAEITVHMIGAHAFFGGPGTSFRIDPEVAAGVVRLT